MEYPHQLPGAHVEGANIARTRFVFLVGGRAQNQQVFEYSSRRSRLNQRQTFGITPPPLAQIDAALVAKIEDRLASPRVDLLQQVVSREQESAIRAIGTFPIVDSAIGNQPRFCVDGMNPQFAAGGCIESHNRIVASQYIHRSINDDWVEQIFVAVSGGISPRYLQLADVGAVDLSEGRILG